MIRIGHGFDVHAFGQDRPLMICGVAVPYHTGFIAHSDGDVVTDSSKFGQYSNFVICEANQIDVLVTDNKLPLSYQEYLENMGVKVLIA